MFNSRKGTVMEVALIGIDLGKNSCSVTGLDHAGQVVLRRRLHRDSILKLADKFPGCVVAMEACCGAHYLGRHLRDRGHEVRLMSPEYVRPYVKAQKNDDRDSEAIAEAATRPTMRFVELKSEDQLDMQILHRARDRLVNERTALANQIRAILLERGITLPQGRQKLENSLTHVIESSGDLLSERIRTLLKEMTLELHTLTRRITTFDKEFETFTRDNEACKRLTTIPGIGALNATAFVAAIDNAQTFGRGRDLAAWLGLVPRQFTTGGKPKLLGISKRGNSYLRRMLIHGARAAMPHLARLETATGAWLRRLIARANPNVVVVALAAKMARVIWAVLQKGTTYQHVVF